MSSQILMGDAQIFTCTGCEENVDNSLKNHVNLIQIWPFQV